jgi:anti-anti-sigma factor
MEAIADAFREASALLVIDICHVSSIDATGLRTLAEAAHLVKDRGARFAVNSPPESQMMRVLQQAGLDCVLHIHESVDEALEHWLGDRGGELISP